LHHIGAAVNYGDPYKHSAHLILSNGLFGYAHREVAVLALVCLHLRGGPLTGTALEAGALERVTKLGVLLKVAEALDVSHAQAVRSIETQVAPKYVKLKLVPRREAGWELEAARGLAAEFGRELEVGEVEISF